MLEWQYMMRRERFARRHENDAGDVLPPNFHPIDLAAGAQSGVFGDITKRECKLRFTGEHQEEARTNCLDRF